MEEKSENPEIRGSWSQTNSRPRTRCSRGRTVRGRGRNAPRGRHHPWNLYGGMHAGIRGRGSWFRGREDVHGRELDVRGREPQILLKSDFWPFRVPFSKFLDSKAYDQIEKR